jgi:hypothetical protein
LVWKFTTSQIETRLEPGKRVLGWLIISGLFMVLQATLLDQALLQDPWIPIHLALVGLFGAFLLGLRRLPSVRKGEIWALAGLSAIPGVGLGFTGHCFTENHGAVLAAGWIILALWCFSIAYRGVRT